MNARVYKQNVDNIQKAIDEFLANGGVVEYTLNSGQGSTKVRVDNLKALTDAYDYFSSKYNEAIQLINGSNINIIRGF